MRSRIFDKPARLGALVAAARLSLLLGVFPTCAVADEAYIPNFGSNSISVIDTATNTVTATIAAGPLPNGITVTPDGTEIVFTNRGPIESIGVPSTGSIAILDRATNIVTATIADDSGPVGVAITPDGKKAYVANAYIVGEPGNLWVIDLTTGSVIDKIKVGDSNIVSVAITPDGRSVYVGNNNDQNNTDSIVTVFSTATNAVTATIPVGQLAYAITFAPDGTQAFVVNDLSGTVSVIDVSTEKVSNTITVGREPWSVQFTPDGKSAWVSNNLDNTVSVIDVASGTVTGTIPTGKGPQGVGFTADGTAAYVTNFADGTVSVIDTATATMIKTIPVGKEPTAFGNFMAPALAAPPPPSLAAAILPGGRSVEIPAAATVFGTILNLTPLELDNCQPGLPDAAPAGLAMHFQTTDSKTNAPTGSPDTPTNVEPNGSQAFVLSFTASSAVTLSGQPLTYRCDNVAEAPSSPGVNTVDLLFSATPIPDIIALGATIGTPGVVAVPFSSDGAAAFAVATANVGAEGSLTVTTDTGNATLPIATTICQTDPGTGACLAPPAQIVTAQFPADATPTFSIFVSAAAPISFAPGASRIFVRFKDTAGVSHGSTSVAVETD